MAKPTIYDIAQRAGVSPATVSRVLNKRGYVRAEMAERVQAAAAELAYTPRHKAPSYRDLILAVAPQESLRSYYTDIFEGMRTAADRHGYSMALTQFSAGSDTALPPLLEQDFVRGIVVLDNSSVLEALRQSPPPYPVVQVNAYLEDLPYPAVTIDDTLAAREAVRYLFATGRRRVALFTLAECYLFSQKRETGYTQGVVEAGADYCEVLRINSFDYQVAYAAAMEFLAGPRRPDAVLAVGDRIGAATARAAGQLGLRVPEDLAIVTFDNSDIALTCSPPLTSVSPPHFEIGRVAVDQLAGLLNGQPLPKEPTLLTAELVVRKST